jgi:predicted lactoylglutathione lyase
MKKAAIPKKGAKNGKRQNPKVDAETVRALRTVKDQEAFYFYEAVGKPTGEVARNLSDFLNKVKIVKSESLVFHLQRKDFQNWVANTLGDSKLAEKLGRISPSNDNNLRTNVCKTVENRIEELRESSLAISIEDERTVVPVRV